MADEAGDQQPTASDAMAPTPYAWLKLHRNVTSVETQKDLLRHLECVNVPDSQRESLHMLDQIEFTHFLRMRRDRRREDVERISERRSKSRARAREKWQSLTPEEGVTVEHVQRQFPGLFQQNVLKTKQQQQQQQQPASVRQPAAHVAPTKEVETSYRLYDRNGGGRDGVPVQQPPRSQAAAALPRHAAPQAPPPMAPVAVVPVPEVLVSVPSMSGPQRALSDLLRKKSHAHEDDEEDEGKDRAQPRTMNPYRHQHARENARSEPVRRNPFQTAGDRLQKDRVQGKHTMDDFHDDGDDNLDPRFKRQGRGLARQAPRSGGYHPANPQVLFGGNSARNGNSHGNDDAHELYDPDDDMGGGDAIRKKFVSPVARTADEKKSSKASGQQPKPTGGGAGAGAEDDEDIDPRLKSCDPELIAKIEMEIVDNGDPITFDDIAGLQFAKKCVNELVIWPMARPDIFTGLRALPKGLLLFGPPGTGKTLIGKAIASQSGATFFSISASSLTSKWIGEGEKLVRTLFAVAAVKQPSVIFIDEIDSLLTQRSSEENEASRRMKTEFLVQLDGAGTKAKDVILVVGATNRPQELDEAARRRFVKRLYIPLPSSEARLDLMNRLLKGNNHELSEQDLSYLAEKTSGYSGADVRALCTEAAMGPIRSCLDIRTMDADSVRPINLEDCDAALRGVRSSVAAKDLDFYRQWNDEFGSFAFTGHEG